MDCRIKMMDQEPSPLTFRKPRKVNGDSLVFQELLMEKANRKAWHNNKVKDKDLAEGDMALTFASQQSKKEAQTTWRKALRSFQGYQDRSMSDMHA